MSNTTLIATLARLIRSFDAILAPIGFTAIVAGGAVNTALGGRPSKDIDVFVLAPDQANWEHWAEVQLQAELLGWANAKRGTGTYGDLLVLNHPQYPHIDLVLNGYGTPEEFIGEFDMPQHRACVLRDGTVIDQRGTDWVVDQPGRAVTHDWRLDKARSYGYTFGPTLDQALLVAEQLAAGRAYEMKIDLHGPAEDYTLSGGSAMVYVQFETEDGLQQEVFRVCVGGAVTHGSELAYTQPVQANHDRMEEQRLSARELLFVRETRSENAAWVAQHPWDDYVRVECSHCRERRTSKRVDTDGHYPQYLCVDCHEAHAQGLKRDLSEVIARL